MNRLRAVVSIFCISCEHIFVPSLQHETKYLKSTLLNINFAHDSDTENNLLYFVWLLCVAPVGFICERFT